MLNLHSGGEAIEFEALRQVPTPPATPTHVPIAHYRLVDLVRHTLSYYNHQVIEEQHAIDYDGMRYYGVMKLKSPYGNYQDVVGLRNSNDRKFPIGIAFGAAVFVCSNLSFMGEHLIKRRHTANAKRDLPGLVQEVIEPLTAQRDAQQRTFERYKHAQLTDERADHTILQMFREGVINVQRIADVVKEWDTPSFAYEQYVERSAWQLFNAATYVLTGRVAENPQSTRKLHQIIDGVCEHVT